jgi:hypothetical protein
MERKRLIKLFGLNLGIAAADIITINSVWIWAGTLGIASGITIIFLTSAGLIYGNYKLLKEPEVVIPVPEIWTMEKYIEELNIYRWSKTFGKNVALLLDQIHRQQKKNKTIRDILLQKFSPTEISYQKFDAVIPEVEKIFFRNIRRIINILEAFDEEGYNIIIDEHEAGAFSPNFIADKLKVYKEYITAAKTCTENNEQLLLKLDELMLEISDLNSADSGQLVKIIDYIDKLKEQVKRYKD